MKTETNFKAWLNQFRKSKGLRIDDLKDMLGVSKSAVANYCSSSREPSLDFLNKLSNAFPELEYKDLLRFVSNNKIQNAGFQSAQVNRKPTTANDVDDFDLFFRDKDEHIAALEEENKALKKQVKQLIDIMASMNK